MILQPLTFVTSVFGMTNMPAEPANFWPFGITLAAICIPFFSVIGFLSTKYGYRIWAKKTKQFWRWLRPKQRIDVPDDTDFEAPTRVNRTMSTEEGMRLRLNNRDEAPRRSMHRPAPSHPHIQRMVERMGEGRSSGLTRMGTVVGDGEFGKEKDDDGSTSKDTVIKINES